ncbi:Molybdopterin or thiamine biosynthesis adenylyltransferase [Bacteroidales bacterium KHT7]|nr:Molybdopterin or thiamine biosynthesis adenylyltransferase [Bacteroidales bacterium KHT7]
MFQFTDEEKERYARHIILKGIGAEGQEKICKGKVLVVGSGGLGSPVLMYLAAAGVGTLGVVDGDVVDLSNLQRQIIHSTDNIGKSKVESARERILTVNPNVNVVTYDEFFTVDNAADIIKDYDFVIDGTDNFDAKFLINDVCVEHGTAYSHGAILRFEGETFTYVPGSACYRCLFDTPPEPGSVPNSKQAGVLGAIAGMLGTIQAAEALKFLTGAGELLTNQLLTFDALSMNFNKIRFGKRKGCVCGE